MKYLKYILPALLLAQLGTSALAAEKEVTIKIKRIYVDDNVYTPYYEIETEQDNNQGSAQRWVRLAVEYSTRGGWINELTLLHSALASDHGNSKQVILTEEVTYMHIGEGNHVSYVYLHPNCAKRYTVKAKQLDSAVTFSINGKIVATKETAKHADKGWSEGSDFTVHSGHLLNESETPFWFVNYDYKEMIKKSSTHNEHSK